MSLARMINPRGLFLVTFVPGEHDFHNIIVRLGDVSIWEPWRLEMSFDTFLDKISNPTFEAPVNIICAQDKRALNAALQVMSEIYLWNDYALPADTLGRLKNARINLLKILSGIPTSEGIRRGDIQGN